jgi:DNA-binding NtrC family response regulator
MGDGEKKILIIDDEPNMCWALDRLLKGAGFSVFKALTGHGALSSIETERFCCVLLDAKLPDMEGLELARRIHKVDPTVRIVMVSGYFYIHDTAVQEALSQGLVSAFIGKPFLNDEVLAAIGAELHA